MTNKAKLFEAIKRQGISRTQFAAAMGFSMPTFYSRVNGVSEFTAAEIITAKTVLRLTDAQRNAIFFARNSE